MASCKDRTHGHRHTNPVGEPRVCWPSEVSLMSPVVSFRTKMNPCSRGQLSVAKILSLVCSLQAWKVLGWSQVTKPCLVTDTHWQDGHDVCWQLLGNVYLEVEVVLYQGIGKESSHMTPECFYKTHKMGGTINLDLTCLHVLWPFFRLQAHSFPLESWENSSASAPNVHSVIGGSVAFLCFVLLGTTAMPVACPPVQCPSSSHCSMWGQDSQAGLTAC